LNEPKLRSILQDRLNRFYILAFAPLIPLFIYRSIVFRDPTGVLVPFYGFIILIIKKDKLSEYSAEPRSLQKALGLAAIVLSLFVYFIIVPFVPVAGIYGIVNYTIYLFGLVMFFFKLPAFKQTFAAFFLIVAMGITGLAYRWIERQITPTVPYYVTVFSLVLNLVGIKHTRPYPDTLYLNTSSGTLLVWFEGGCIGVYSVIFFSILVIVTMAETSAPKRTKVLWATIGLAGVFILNIIRLLIVVITMYFYGWDFGQQVHKVIGYILFLSWLAIFLLLFSKRNAIMNRLKRIQPDPLKFRL
jgi:exosortase/archaeosortase family protein